MRKYRYNLYFALLVVTVLLIPAVLIYGLTRSRASPEEEPGRPVPEDVYRLNERTVAEFQPAIVEKFNEQSELVVYSIEYSEPLDLKQTGIIDWSVLNKSQTLTYKGTANFYVDMSALSGKNVSLNAKDHAVVIEIPHTRLAPIEIDPDKFETGETQKGFLAFGELRFTPKEYNSLEKEAKRKILEAADTPANREKADAIALQELKKIYDPVVNLIDHDYSVEIVFLK